MLSKLMQTLLGYARTCTNKSRVKETSFDDHLFPVWRCTTCPGHMRRQRCVTCPGQRRPQCHVPGSHRRRRCVTCPGHIGVRDVTCLGHMRRRRCLICTCAPPDTCHYIFIVAMIAGRDTASLLHRRICICFFSGSVCPTANQRPVQAFICRQSRASDLAFRH